MKAFVVVISGLLLSAPVFAQGNGGTMTGSGAAIATGSNELPPEAAATEEGGEGENRRICRRVEIASGSRMSYRRLCMTARQWRDFNRTN